MSIQRITTSHTLAQRLDTLLGTKLAQQLATSTRPTTQDFIPQTPRALPPESAPQSPQRPLGPPAQTPEHEARQALSQHTRQASGSVSLARGLPGLQATDLPGTPSAPISLGGTAQLLVQLLRHYPCPLPAISQPQALLPSPPAQPAVNAQPSAPPIPGILSFSSPVAATLFQALEHAVSRSGLFYESHLSQYAAGRYPRAPLSMEPQARLATDASAESAPANAPPSSSSARAPHVAQEGTPPGTNPTESRPAHSTHAQNTLPADAALLVRQQLEALAMQTIQWRGEAWPQAAMHWSLSRDAQHQETETDEVAQQWSSQLTLQLPRLGDIHVRLHLKGQSLSIQLAAPQAEDRLNAQAHALRQQLLATGLTLQQLLISPTFEALAEPPADAGGPAGPAAREHHE